MRRKIENRCNIETIGEMLHVSNGNEQFSIDYFEKKGCPWKRRLHYHDFYELEFVLDGHAENIINGMCFGLSRGMMFLIRPTDVHRYEIAPDETISVCTVRFTSALLDGEIVSALSGSDPLIADLSDHYDFLRELLADTRREYLEKDSFSDIIFSGTVSRLSVLLCRERSVETPIRTNRVAASAVEYINRCYDRHITIRSAAEQLGVSPNHLGKVFSDSMNMTFAEYLRRVRLIFALNRIVNTDDAIQKTALESGFSSPSVFTREFRKYYGKSPSALRSGKEGRPE